MANVFFLQLNIGSVFRVSYSGETRTDKELQETLSYLNQCYDGCVCELKAKQPNGSQHPCCTGRIGQLCSYLSNVELPLVYSPCCFHFTHHQILQSVPLQQTTTHRHWTSSTPFSLLQLFIFCFPSTVGLFVVNRHSICVKKWTP